MGATLLVCLSNGGGGGRIDRTFFLLFLTFRLPRFPPKTAAISTWTRPMFGLTTSKPLERYLVVHKPDEQKEKRRGRAFRIEPQARQQLGEPPAVRDEMQTREAHRQLQLPIRRSSRMGGVGPVTAAVRRPQWC